MNILIALRFLFSEIYILAAQSINENPCTREYRRDILSREERKRDSRVPCLSSLDMRARLIYGPSCARRFVYIYERVTHVG